MHQGIQTNKEENSRSILTFFLKTGENDDDVTFLTLILKLTYDSIYLLSFYTQGRPTNKTSSFFKFRRIMLTSLSGSMVRNAFSPIQFKTKKMY